MRFIRRAACMTWDTENHNHKAGQQRRQEMNEAIIECLQEEGPVTFTGTLMSASMRMNYYWRQAVIGFIRAFH